VCRPNPSARAITFSGAVFEAHLEPRAQWTLDHLGGADLAQVRDCIYELERDPCPPESRRALLSIPHERLRLPAYRCGDWLVALEVVDDAFFDVLAIGPGWPTQHPSLRRP
jgi:hypothetical protein